MFRPLVASGNQRKKPPYVPQHASSVSWRLPIATGHRCDLHFPYASVAQVGVCVWLAAERSVGDWKGTLSRLQEQFSGRYLRHTVRWRQDDVLVCSTVLRFRIFFVFSELHSCTEEALYKVFQIWLGQTVTCLHTNSPSHIWTTLYNNASSHSRHQINTVGCTLHLLRNEGLAWPKRVA
jgi:hypothetical protein